MRSFSPAKTIRILLASLLSLWVAGAGCMLGCESMVAYAASGGSAPSTHHPNQTATIVASGHACSSAETSKSHDCCNKSAKVKPHAPSSGDASILEFGGSSSGTMNGCPLAVSRAVVVAKAHSGDLSATPSLAQSTLPDLNSLERTARLSRPLRLPNRGHTYLRCCVFLI